MAKYRKLLPILIALALLAGLPAAVSAQATPRVEIADSIYTATEGVDSEVEITVEMTPSFGSEVSVGLDLDTECSSGGQLEVEDSTVTFSAGTTSQTVAIQICNDSVVEDEIDVPIRLERLTSTPAEVTVNSAFSVVRITDDRTDTATVGFTLTEFENQEEETQAEISVEVTGEVCVDFSVLLETRDITAYSRHDYRSISIGVDFYNDCADNDRETQKSVRLSLVNDRIAEETETLRATLSRRPGMDSRIAIAPAEATVSIVDSDTANVGFQRTSIDLREDSGEFFLGVEVRNSASCPVAFSFEANITYNDPNFLLADRESIPSSLMFEPCDRVRGLNIGIRDDASVTGTQEVTFTLEGVTRTSDGADVSSQLLIGTASTMTVRVQDDDTAVVGLEKPYYLVREETTSLRLCVSVFTPRDRCPIVSAFDLEVSYSDPHGLVVPETVLQPIQFRACQVKSCIDIPIANDDRVEDIKKFTLMLGRTPSTPDDITLEPDMAEVVVRDQDFARVELETDQSFVSEGSSFDVEAMIVVPEVECPVEFEFDLLLLQAIPRGARPFISTVPQLVSFKPCEDSRAISVSTVGMEATAELKFALDRLSPSSSRDYLIHVNREIATTIVIDEGGTTEAFETLIDASNTQTNGISSDGTTMWTADLGGQKLYAYNLATKARDADKDLDSLDARNGAPDGIWTNGTTTWVADGTADKIFAYDITTKERNADEDFNTLDAAGNGGPEGIWSDGTTMWVADGLADKLYAYDMATKEWDSDKDFDTLAAAENNLPAGIWSDRTTMWVADWEDDKIYAYNMATKERDAGKDFNALTATGNNNPLGIWSDGSIMWVADWEDDKIYAYYFPVEPVLPTTSRRTTTGTVSTTETDETDPARPSVIKPDLCVADIVDPDGGEIELGDTITDSWVSGCPSVTRGGRLAKYYTFDLPITTTAEIALDSHLDDYLVLRRGGLSGSVVEQDDDDGPGNNSLISSALTAGRYTIEATTFYADGVEADFTLSVKAVPRILYDGPVADIAHADYTPDGPTMTVKLLPTLPMGTLEVTIEDANGFGEGAGPLGGAQADGGSAGTVMLALPKTAWVQYDGIDVEVRRSGTWSAHTQADEQAMLTRRAAGPDLSPVLLGLVRLIGKAEGALQLLQSLAGLSSLATDTSPAEPDESVLDTIFRKSYANCVSQVTVPWLVNAEDTTGVRISVPVTLADTDYLSLAASFVASGNEPALAQLHNLLNTCIDAPACQRPEPSAE